MTIEDVRISYEWEKVVFPHLKARLEALTLQQAQAAEQSNLPKMQYLAGAIAEVYRLLGAEALARPTTTEKEAEDDERRRARVKPGWGNRFLRNIRAGRGSE